MIRAAAEMERDVSEGETEAEAHALLHNFIQKRLPRLTKTSLQNCLCVHGTSSPFACVMN